MLGHATGAGGQVVSDENVVDAILAHAIARPEAPAIETAAYAVDRGTLVRAMAAVAAGLEALGVAPGSTIALSTRQPSATLTTLFGTLLGGHVALQLDPDGSAEERGRFAAQAGAAAILCDHPLQDARPLQNAHPLQNDWPHALKLRDVMAAGAGADPAAARRPGGARPAQINLSSGTTGQRKVAPVSHDQQLARSRQVIAALGQGVDDRYLPIVKLYFGYGRQGAMRTLLAGGTVVAKPLPESTDRLLAMIAEERITYLEMTPSHIRFLLDRLPPGAGMAMPGVRCMVVSTAMLPPSDRQEIRQRLTPNLHVSYGINEAGVVACARPQDLDRHIATVGRAMPGNEIVILDDAGQPVTDGGVGELRVRSTKAARQYLGDADATDRAFRDGWFVTGDTGRVDEEGYLFLTGRMDDRINYGGLKIYPVEIEDVLAAHEAVADAAAVGVPSRRFQEVPVAAVVLRGQVEETELIRHCRAMLGLWRSPVAISILPALPQTPMGKTDRIELRRVMAERVGDVS